MTLIKKKQEIIGIVVPELSNESRDLECNKIKGLDKLNLSSNKTRPLKVELHDELFYNNIIQNET